MAITALGVGSGLDLSGLLDQLQAGEREKLTPITQQKQSYQAKISAYGRLEGLLSKFQTAAEALNDASLFHSTKSSVDGDAVNAAASTDAEVGSYSVEVEHLARAYSVATDGVEDRTTNLGAGTVSLELANGDTVTAEISAESSSLEDIRDAINAQDGGVRASIINDGGASPYRLALTSSSTGSEAAISSMDFGTTGLVADATTEITAKNASLTVNGVPISSQTNQVEGALQGVTLSIEEAGLATVEVARDSEGIENAVKGFVSAYNELQGSMSSLTSYNAESGAAGRLLGDSALRGIQSSMRSTMTSAAGEGSLQMLSDVGISLQLDGTLELDEEALSELVDNDPSALAGFFSGSSEESGLSGRLSQTLEQMLSDNGALNSASTGLKSSIERLDERYLQMEKGIDSTIARYRRQFGQLDSMISQMNSTSAYLTQQFDNMNAQLGRK